MADTFKLTGSYTTEPTSGAPSGDPAIEAAIDEACVLGKKHYTTVVLSTDALTAVNFGGLTNAHVIVIRSEGGKVKVTLTSADGTAQAVPVQYLLAVMNDTVPVTAIGLTRVVGTSTTVRVFLGELE